MKKKIFYLSLLFMSLSASHASISKEKSIPKRNSFLHKKRVAKKKQRAIKNNNKKIIKYLIVQSFVVLIFLLPVAIYNYKNEWGDEYTLDKDIMNCIKEESDKYDVLADWLIEENSKMKSLNSRLKTLEIDLNEDNLDAEAEEYLKDGIKNIITDIGWVIDDREAEITSNRKRSQCLIKILKKENNLKTNSVIDSYLDECYDRIPIYPLMLEFIKKRKNIEIREIKFKEDLNKSEEGGKKNKEDLNKFKDLEGASDNLKKLRKERNNLSIVFNKMEEVNLNAPSHSTPCYWI